MITDATVKFPYKPETTHDVKDLIFKVYLINNKFKKKKCLLTIKNSFWIRIKKEDSDIKAMSKKLNHIHGLKILISTNYIIKM